MNGVWRRYNNCVNSIKNQVCCIKSKRYLEHVIGQKETNPTKKILQARPKGTRRSVRPKLRWTIRVDNDDKQIGPQS